MAVKKKCFSKVGIIGGSKAYLTIDKSWGKQISRKIIKTPFGNSAPLYIYEKDGIHFAFISRHGEKGYDVSAPFVNYRANIWALKEIGVERIVSWSGPGIINISKFKVADIVLPDDIIDETKTRKNTFFENKGIGFVRQNPVFCPDLADMVYNCAKKMKINVKKGGVYVCTEGPRLETAAEIKMYKILGADLVGMTLAPECFLARELEICYQPICYLTNVAEGIGRKKSFQSGILFEGMQNKDEAVKVQETLEKIPSLIFRFIKENYAKERKCSCKDYMLRYKKSGILSDNWKDWFK
ncbi:MAG: phosphorylase [Candidatus Schekmanbacteria bacterium]|nr:MAG: phosphorylase [Candidatus Schekmanbacteria bacterium]